MQLLFLAHVDAHGTIAFASQTPREFDVFTTDVAMGDGSSDGTNEWAPIFTEPK